MRVVIAPDSYKGGPGAAEVAHALADGWRQSRAGDELLELPLADGGEGTLDAIGAAVAGAERRPVTGVRGPDDRPVDASFLLLPDGTAVAELALASGLPMMSRLDPLGAHTVGLGEVIREVLRTGARRLLVGVGGSASTDGGLGALHALGLRALAADGSEIPDGGGALRQLASIDRTALLAPPVDGVEVLTDVESPLTGPRGAAAVFGPQKGADPAQIEQLDRALRHLAEVLGGDPQQPGAGAAGGTAYGFATLWDARLRSGSEAIAAQVGLDDAVRSADLVVTGEGYLDATSFVGKVVGTVAACAHRHGIPMAVACGGADPEVSGTRPGVAVVSLTDLAGGIAASMADPLRFLREAGRTLADAQRG